MKKVNRHCRIIAGSIKRVNTPSRREEFLTTWFAESEEWEQEFDDLATTFLSTGAILAAAALCGDFSLEGLVARTHLPPRFVELVLGCFMYRNCQASDWFLDLQTTLRCCHQDARECLAWALEQFWLTPEVSELADRLTELRDSRLVGGAMQTWLDIEDDSVATLPGQVH